MWLIHRMSNFCLLTRRWKFLALALSLGSCHGSPSLDSIKQMRVSSKTMLWKTKKRAENVWHLQIMKVKDLTSWQFWPVDLTTVDLRYLSHSGFHHLTRTCDQPQFSNDKEKVVNYTRSRTDITKEFSNLELPNKSTEIRLSIYT